MSAPITMNLFGELFLGLSLIKFRIVISLPVIMIIFLSACYSMFIYRYINHGKSWVIFRNKSISIREYYLLLLHFFPIII
uniref:NADH-ubiquinone oxidoreductase chain 4 n=1 Tax=Rhipicephalus appendiculatus TaxID=34631 RepID=A0A131YHF3_RHIAP